MAAPVYQALGAVASGVGAVSASWPAGHMTNDLGLLIVETANESVATPAGWTLLAARASAGALAVATKATVFWRRATSSSEAAASIADAGDHVIAHIATYRGVIPAGDPFTTFASAAAVGDGSTAAFSAPAITTAVDDSLVVVIATEAGNAGSGTASMANAGLVGVSRNFDVASTAGNDGSIAAGSGVKSVAGATGSTTVTWPVVPPVGNGIVLLTLDLRPPGVDTGAAAAFFAMF